MKAIRAEHAAQQLGQLAALPRCQRRQQIRRRLGERTVDRALGQAATDVDVVIDYTWGASAQRAMPAVLTHRTDRSKPLTWLQIGAVAGPTIELQSSWLRAARIEILGSGQGSVPTQAFVAELPALADEISAGTFAVHAVPTALSRVQAAWNAPATPGERIVFTP